MEKEIGVVKHYFTRLEVAGVILKDDLAVGDRILIKGHASNFAQIVDSMQIDNRDVDQAKAGDLVGIHIVEPAREGDIIYKI